jgi:argininosuccinate lyase
MPQKKNPYALAYVRAVANRTIGVQAGVAAAGRTPSGQMDNRLFAYGDVPAALDAVAGAAALIAEVVQHLRFDESAAQRALERSWTFASELAELIMREGGLDYRAAHALVGPLARARGEADASRRDGGVPTVDDVAAAAREMFGREIRLQPRDLADVLDARAAVERRNGSGGASPVRVGEMVAEVRDRAAAVAAWSDEMGSSMVTAERALLDTARSLAEAR